MIVIDYYKKMTSIIEDKKLSEAKKLSKIIELANSMEGKFFIDNNKIFYFGHTNINIDESNLVSIYFDEFIDPKISLVAVAISHEYQFGTLICDKINEITSDFEREVFYLVNFSGKTSESILAFMNCHRKNIKESLNITNKFLIDSLCLGYTDLKL